MQNSIDFPRDNWKNQISQKLFAIKIVLTNFRAAFGKNELPSIICFTYVNIQF